MKIEELRAAIENYPQRLYEAMQAVDKAERTIEKINEQIEEEEIALSPEEENTPPPSEEEQDDTIQETLLRLDHELGMLELHAEQARGEIELEYRRNPPHGDKVTEATVTAFVKSHTRFVEAKSSVLEKKYERDKANQSRRVGYVASVAERREARHLPPVTSPKLDRLRERLAAAEFEQSCAEMRVEEVKASILPYQLLVQLYTAGLIS